MYKYLLKTDKRKINIAFLLNIFLISYIIFAIYISFRMNYEQRSLWYDEALLSFSFTKRNLLNLTSGVFEHDQTCSIIYLYIVKVLTTIFGNTEFTLRIWSFICYLISLVATFYISKKILQFKFPLLPVAVLSSLSIMFLYANEFKPYMFDTALVLCLIIVFYLYSTKTINRTIFNLLLIISVWASNPVCFFIASILLIELIEGVRSKDFKLVKYSIFSGCLSFSSFVIYYFYWLKPVIDKGFMSQYWAHKRLNLLPATYDELLYQLEIFKELFDTFYPLNYIVILSIICGFFINVFICKNRYITVIYLALVITLIASSFGMFPLQDRMCMFIYPLFVILLFFSLNRLYLNKSTAVFAICISMIMLFSTSSIRYYRNLYNTYKPFQEFNASYNYILENIQEDDKVYFSVYATPALCYKNNYDTLSIGGFSDNVILGKSRPRLIDKQREEARRIADEKKVYIVQVHAKLDTLLETLEKYGIVEIVHEFRSTPVFLYKKID